MERCIAKDGRLDVLLQRPRASSRYTIAADSAAAGRAPRRSGPHFAYDGGGLGKGGTVTLYAGETQDRRGPRRADAAVHVLDGRDRSTSAATSPRRSRPTTAPSGNAFTGTIEWVRLDVGDDDHDHLIDPAHQDADRDDPAVTDERRRAGAAVVDGRRRRDEAIVDFVASGHDGGGPDAVPAEERIAVFDNDGTLWTEKPMPVELVFILKRWGEMAEADPSLKDRQPWKAAVERDYAFLAGAFDKHYLGDDTDIKVDHGRRHRRLRRAWRSRPTARAAADFVREGQHPTLQRPFGTVGYQPMIELLRYLEANGFTTLIASGGNRDFMRGVRRGHATACRRSGSSARPTSSTSVEDGDGSVRLCRGARRVRRRPGQAGPHLEPDRSAAARRRRQLQRRHPDARVRRHVGPAGPPAARAPRRPRREFDYVKGAETALERAKAEGWTVISVKDDWATVFADA